MAAYYTCLVNFSKVFVKWTRKIVEGLAVETVENDSSSLIDDLTVTEQEAKSELERVLSDPEFHCTERNKKFLRFVAEELFEGRAGAIKAYTIAVDVFGRPPSFDPSTDPIVRIEATRLRAALVRYYETRGQGGARIDLPKGRYIPVFSKMDAATDTASYSSPDADVDARALPVHPVAAYSLLRPAVKAKWFSISLGVMGGAVLGGFLLFGLLHRTEAGVLSEKPDVSIELKLTGDRAADAEALDLRDALMVALSQFQTLRVASTEVPEGSDLDAALKTRSIGARQGSYKVVLKYRSDPSGRSVWWQVIDMSSGEALRSGDEKALANEYSASDVERDLANRLAVQFAGARGAINSIETLRELANTTLGNGCILRAYLAFEAHEAEALEPVRTCLEQTLALRPNDADAHAMLAAVLLAMDPAEAPTELSRRAMQLADRSVALAPFSDRSAYAQMQAQFRAGQIDAALLSGRRAMTLNPNNSVIAVKFGSLLFAAGKWDEGVALALNATRIESAVHKEAAITLAMDAYRREAYDEALVHLQYMGDPRCYCARVLLVATLAQLGRKSEAETAAQALRNYRPEIEKSFRSDMAARHYVPPMIASLEYGLAKAGFRLQ